MRIDPHTHSNASDGTLTPAEGMAAAAEAGRDVVGLAGHATAAGWAAASVAAEAVGISLLPGVELSCRWYDVEPAIPLHLLAYLVDPTDGALSAEMARVREARENRAAR